MLKEVKNIQNCDKTMFIKKRKPKYNLKKIYLNNNL